MGTDMWSIAATALAQLRRSRPVLVGGAMVPVAVSALLVWRNDAVASAGPGHVAAVMVFAVAGFGTYAAIEPSPATGHQDLHLQRSPLPGLLLATGVAMLLLSLPLVVLGAVTTAPGAPGTFVGATVLVLGMLVPLGPAVAGATRSPGLARAATITVLVGVVLIATWVGVTGTDELTGVKRLLPGGGATELMITAWQGTVVASDVPLMVGPTLWWVAASAFLGSRCREQHSPVARSGARAARGA